MINVRVLEKCGNVAQDRPIQRLEEEVFNIHFSKILFHGPVQTAAFVLSKSKDDLLGFCISDGDVFTLPLEAGVGAQEWLAIYDVQHWTAILVLS